MAASQPLHHESYRRLMTLHRQSYETIAEALKLAEKIKEKGAKESSTERKQLIELYDKGLNQLKAGIQLHVRTSDDNQKSKAESIQSKMRTNMDYVKIQLEELKSQSRVSSATVAKDTFNRPTSRPSSSSNLSNNTSRIAKPTALKASRVTKSKDSRSLSPQKRVLNDQSKPTIKLTPAPELVPSPSQVRRSESDASDKSTSSTKAKDDLRKRVNRMKGIDSKLACTILDNVLETSNKISFNDIHGLDQAKRALYEAVILPALNPGVFTGLRQPSRGILLFGPPGNGKTMLAKAVANEGNCTFFNISASAITSKWVGETEKLVRAMFAMARELQPSIIFIDEIDSVLCERNEREQDTSRRLKTQFLVEFDGVRHHISSQHNRITQVASEGCERVLVMGATNRPFDLDDAVIRRFKKRIYIGLPDAEARAALLSKLLSKQKTRLPAEDLKAIAAQTERYSYNDLRYVAEEAAMEPIRELPPERIAKLKESQLRKITLADLERAIQRIRPSAKPELVGRLEHYAQEYGER